MNDPYVYEGSHVLINKLGLRDEKSLDLAEAELSRDNMLTLYECGFHHFSTEGICEIHHFLFQDVYEWAGKFRTINLSKREEILGGRSVWYANDEDIQRDLDRAWKKIHAQNWDSLSREGFAEKVAHLFPALWQAHPFREGNTRTIVMLMTFFVEDHGYFMDQELLQEAAGYVRNAFVMASIGKYAEYDHLERILRDAICEEPVEGDAEEYQTDAKTQKYQQYKIADAPVYAHEYRAETEPTADKYYQ